MRGRLLNVTGGIRPKRLRALGLSALLALAGSVPAAVGAVYLSWRVDTAGQRATLATTAQAVIQHTGDIYSSATAALRSMAATDYAPCSDQHIRHMRQLMVSSPITVGVAYVHDGVFRCSAFGLFDDQRRQSAPDVTRPDGVSIHIGVQSRFAPQVDVIALGFGDHAILIDPSLLLGYAIAPGISVMLLADDGQLIAARDRDAAINVQTLASREGTGTENDVNYAVVRQDGWTVIATEPAIGLTAYVRAESPMLLWLVVIITACSGSVIFWLTRRRHSALSELAAAVRHREFVVHYQPIIELETGRCIGAEALVRWRRPDGTMARPDEFIPLAETSGLIRPITDQVIERVVFDLNQMLVANRSLHVTINLCAEDISTGRFLPVLAAALDHTGIWPEQILLEATERGFIDVEGARRTLIEARRIGHGTAIDDFGTGYSSLQYLQTLPLNALKIDKSFVDTIGRGAATSSVTPHIIDMAKTLNLLIVAEGVERQDQADYLNERGVELAQGWLFAKPLPPEGFIAFYQQRQQRFGAAPVRIKDSPRRPASRLAAGAPAAPATHP
ncbi:EAL domain-containing protein [Ancylobacter sp. A5.8]|uniref:EAL domain-containing protein n=1 Tax=Ancylobacter gelatini TaxID=2919920 RepID=UPI001F4EFCA4|nr:EAL domain-containing protein [Ancylobacter gelatini]MCJ8144332.1 EAL domain-containing protein [Ancylobacter gelatini]